MQKSKISAIIFAHSITALIVMILVLLSIGGLQGIIYEIGLINFSLGVFAQMIISLSGMIIGVLVANARTSKYYDIPKNPRSIALGSALLYFIIIDLIQFVKGYFVLNINFITYTQNFIYDMIVRDIPINLLLICLYLLIVYFGLRYVYGHNLQDK